jgi:DNA-binding transcriptional LysR family regulator
MDSLDCLMAFVRTFEGRSFSAAARSLGISQPTVSKRIAELERTWGTQLLVRTTRRLHPTPDGIRLYEHARQAIESVERAKASVVSASRIPTGKLHVAAPVWFGRSCILPHLPAYLEQYTAVGIELQLTDGAVDLIRDGIELAIRIGHLPSSSFIARRIGATEHTAVASPAYLHRHRSLQSPDDLADHVCVIQSGQKQPERWVFDSDQGRHVVDVNGRLWVDDVDAVREAVLAGLGVGLLPFASVRAAVGQGQLSVLLPEYHPASLPINAVYPHGTGLSLRARSFIDFLIKCLAVDARSRGAQNSRRRSPPHGKSARRRPADH